MRVRPRLRGKFKRARKDESARPQVRNDGNFRGSREYP